MLTPPAHNPSRHHPRSHASLLNVCLPAPDAANAALQGGAQQPGPSAAAGPLGALLSGLLQAGAGAVGALTGAAGGGGGGGGGGGDAAFRPPPRVLGYVGEAPKSFPLQMRHSGR
jgi:hypothetical protein